jgi:hypothetical protein
MVNEKYFPLAQTIPKNLSTFVYLKMKSCIQNYGKSERKMLKDIFWLYEDFGSKKFIIT